ncbi:Uncharacterised protein [Aquipseudomonas alcaligenes]|nr:Uncharacterised protein [Pseudomonas alcaligenes]
MRAHKIPYGVLSTARLSKTILEASIRFICRDDQILFYGSGSSYCFEAAFLLIDRRNVCNDKTRFLKTDLNSVPDSRLCV